MFRIKTAVFTAAGLMILTACMPHNTGKANHNPEKGKEAMEQVKKGSLDQVKQQCRSKLHKAQSRDDLLKQMYETAILDDCLYAMDVEELERIWGIPVRMADPNDQALLKDLHSPIGLHVTKTELVDGSNRTYYLEMTKSEFHRSGTLFPEGRFPAFLPEPEGFDGEEGLANRLDWVPSGNPYIGPEDGPIRYNWQYIWRINGRIMEAWHWYYGAIGHLEFHEHANGRFDKF